MVHPNLEPNLAANETADIRPAVDTHRQRPIGLFTAVTSQADRFRSWWLEPHVRAARHEG